MIKLFLLLGSLIGVVYFFNWLTSYSGQILFQINEYEITVSLVFFITALAAIIISAIILWIILAYFFSLPKRFKNLNKQKLIKEFKNL